MHVWCIIIGIMYKNSIGRCFKINKSLLSLEFFIKISIVLLAINLRNVLVGGAKVLVVAWVETIILFITVYLIETKYCQWILTKVF